MEESSCKKIKYYIIVKQKKGLTMDFQKKILHSIAKQIEEIRIQEDYNESFFKISNKTSAEALFLFEMIDFINTNVEKNSQDQVFSQVSKEALADFFLIIFNDSLPINNFDIKKNELLDNTYQISFNSFNFKSLNVIIFNTKNKNISISNKDLNVENLSCDTEEWLNLIKWLFNINRIKI